MITLKPLIAQVSKLSDYCWSWFKEIWRIKGKNRSIKGSLLRYLLIGLPLIWLLAIVFAAVPVFYETNKQNDNEMLQMGQLLAQISVDFNESTVLPASAIVLQTYHQSDDNFDTGFAVWDSSGQLLVASHLGKNFPYRSDYEGFINTKPWWRDAAIRVLYLNTNEGKTIAVGRLWDERLEITQTTMLAIFWTLLLVIPLLIVFTLWAIVQGLATLRQLSKTVDNRDADDLTPLKQDIPQELQPFIQALNRLFVRVNNTMEREQRFTADAAHELRSPLAAIKAQSEVLILSQDREKQLHHAEQIRSAADRASHLIEQLLTLSRLDPISVTATGQAIDWLAVSENALQSVNRLAREKRLNLQRHINADTPENILPLSGDPTLLMLLLRNLLDNAIRYGYDEINENKSNNVVELTLASNAITVRDHGKGIAAEHLQRVRERFFRPAGQSEIGSGLGLSIVEQIAELHGLTFCLLNHPDAGVVASLSKKSNR